MRRARRMTPILHFLAPASILIILLVHEPCLAAPDTGARKTVAGAPAGRIDPLARPGPSRLPGIAVPTAYDLRLKIDPRQPTFSGDVTISLDVKAATKTIHVHALDITVASAFVEAGGRKLEGVVSGAVEEGSEPEVGEKAVTFPEPLPPGPARLTFRFEGPFNEQLSGLYRAKEENERWYAYTQFETAEARRAFPCMDEPRF